MIVVTLEIWNGGNPEDKEQLGRILIDNRLVKSIETDGKRGDYRARIFKKRKNTLSQMVYVRDYPRLSYHPWELVRRVLNEAKNGN